MKIISVSCESECFIEFNSECAILFLKNNAGLLLVFYEGLEVATVEMIDNRIVLLRKGNSYQVQDALLYGYLLQCECLDLARFLLQDVAHRNIGLFRSEDIVPYLDVDLTNVSFLNSLIAQLTLELERPTYDRSYQAYFNVLLSHINVNAKDFKPDLALMHFANRISALIDTHFISQRSTTFYAEQLGVTERSLNKLTYKIFNMRFFELLMNRLLNEAELKLTHLDVPIKVIAYDLGFSHSGHFNTYFKRYKGISPTEYRHKLIR